ncbi:putative holin-like toxin [Paenibacillus sp. FSL H8-0259]
MRKLSNVFEALTLMLAFGSLVVAVMDAKKRS